ncbi:hypothetical protein [Salinigranum rubrum]|uniref:hypothetical protein n=1 Tax=Salinigranum rubrum TaxID=755307 RepID=UPI001FE63A9F|nr:hypothetical protein [Salinigranum rubrum]
MATVHARTARGTAKDGRSGLIELAENPTVWILAFVAAIAVFGGATIAFVGGGVSESAVQLGGIVLLVAGGLVAVGYLFFGTFIAARGRGLGNAAAAALGSWVLGLAFILVLVAKLMGMI